MIAAQLLNNSVIPLTLTDNSATALSLMDDYRVLHVPVVDGSGFVGLLSEKDVYEINDYDAPLGPYVHKLKKSYVYEEQHIYEVIRLSSEMQLTLVPVIDAKNKYLGCVTLPELIENVAGMFSVVNPGGIIVLEMSYNDYSLSEISQIVESNNAKVLSLFITSFTNSTKIEVTLKLNRINLKPVIQTFHRYNYFIKASFNEESEYYDLKERYDSLMRYLDT